MGFFRHANIDPPVISYNPVVRTLTGEAKSAFKEFDTTLQSWLKKAEALTTKGQNASLAFTFIGSFFTALFGVANTIIPNVIPDETTSAMASTVCGALEAATGILTIAAGTWALGAIANTDKTVDFNLGNCLQNGIERGYLPLSYSQGIADIYIIPKRTLEPLHVAAPASLYQDNLS